MNTSVQFRKAYMKYTHNLIFGNFFVSRIIYGKEDNFFLTVLPFIDLVRTFVLLGLATFLLPFALTLDFGRLLIYFHLRASRKYKNISIVYSLRKNTVNFFYRSGLVAYLKNRFNHSFKTVPNE